MRENIIQISNADIAYAIVSVASDNIDVFLDLLRREGYKHKTSPWHILCRNILPLGTCDRTVDKYVQKCYYRFRRYSNNIKLLIDERLKDNIQDAVAISYPKMDICHNVIDEVQYVKEPDRSATSISSTDMVSDCTETFQCPTDDSILINEYINDTKIDSTEKKTQKPIKTNWQEGKQIVLPRNFFELFWNGGKTLLKGWTDAFNDVFKIQYPKCVLAFKDHECFAEGTRTSDISFQARAICKHEHCTKYKFFVKGSIIDPYISKPVHVFLEKEIQHYEGNVHRRFMRHQKRAALADELEKHLPLYVKYNCLNKACIESLEAGNCTEVPSLSVLQKIRSENATKDDLSKDFDTFMKKLIEKYDKEWPGKVFNGYINRYSVKPFYIVLIAEDVLRYVISLKPGLVTANLDATGSLIDPPPWTTAQILYYALILPGSEEYGPMPFAEFISSVHSTLDIRQFLDIVCDCFTKITSHSPVIDKIETDFSLALLQSVSRAFNNISLSEYIEAVYEDTERGIPIPAGWTIIHICSSHCLNTALKKIKKIFFKSKKMKSMRTIAANLVAQLIHSKSVQEAEPIIRNIVRFFGFENEIPDFDMRLKCIKHSRNEEFDFSQTNDKPNDNERLNDQSKRRNSPYFKIFDSIKADVLRENNVAAPKNKWYSPKLIKYVFEYLLPYFCLWSAVVIRRFNMTRDSNAPIENYFKITKQQLHESKMHVPATRFIQKSEPFIRARLKERKFDMISTRQKKRKCVIDENITETWKRTKKNRINRFFTCSKFLSANKNKLQKTTTDFHAVNEDKDISINSETSVEIQYSDESSDAQSSSTEESSNIISNPTVNYDNNNVEKIPWIHTISDYPANWMESSFHIGKYFINKDSLQTLLPDRYLDDNIINAFFAILKETPQDEPLIFDAHFLSSLLQTDDGRVGFLRWARQMKAWTYDIWLVPLCRNAHWTLYVVVFPHKIILCIDSLHGSSSSNVLNKLCGFIEKLHMRMDTPVFNWAEWVFHRPVDVPSQRTVAGVGSNCGIHVCVWAYIICHGEYWIFDESDMTNARKWIMTELLKSQKNKKNIDTKNDRDMFHIQKIVFKNDTASSIKISTEPPMASQSTVEYCASLKLLILRNYES